MENGVTINAEVWNRACAEQSHDEHESRVYFRFLFLYAALQ